MGRNRNMGKSRKEIRNRSKIVIPSLLLLIVICSYFTYYTYMESDKVLAKKREFERKLDVVITEYDNLYKEKELLKIEEEEIKNIDTKMIQVKEKVFSLAKDVEEKIQNGNSNYKIAYITFDDGPYHLTDKVLELLKEKKVKATFFTIGQDKDICYDDSAFSCSETYKKIVEAGHTIANHTYSHAINRGLYSSSDEFIKQVKKQEELIESRTGIKTTILRFPGGIGTANARLGYTGVEDIKNRLREIGYGWVDWTAQDGDGGYLPSYTQGWNTFVSSIDQPIEVVLFHDYSYVTYSLLNDAINYLENNNYILLPLFYDSIMISK